MRQQGHFMPQIRADHQHALEVIDVADLEAEMREHRVALLIPKIQLAQPVIDIGAAQAARNLRQQVQLLDAWPWASPGIPRRRRRERRSLSAGLRLPR